LLLADPSTVTTTGPVVAVAGTSAEICVLLQLLMVVAFTPLKLTVLLPCGDPKFVPLIVTVEPTAPLLGLRLLTDGAVTTYVNRSAELVALVPPAVVTVTSTVPALLPGGETAVMLVAEFTVTLVAAVPPKATVVAPAMKLVPVIPTEVPPNAEPLVTVRPLTVGTGTKYVKWSAALVALVPPAVVTVTSTVPALALGGETAVMLVAEFTVTLVAAVPPKATVVAPGIKLAPAIPTEVPPDVEPLVTVRLVTVGVPALTVKADTGETPLAVTTVTLTEPADAIELAGTAAVNCPAFTKVVFKDAPFHSTLAAEVKLVPFTVKLKAAPPAVADEGERPVMVGAGTGAWIVYAALATSLLSYPVAAAMAFKVELCEIVIAPVNSVELMLGFVPSKV
jgi:hypothetical protein